jgi:hypothetical protein
VSPIIGGPHRFLIPLNNRSLSLSALSALAALSAFSALPALAAFPALRTLSALPAL